MRGRAAALALTGALAVVALGGCRGDGYLVQRYCAFGAESEAQFDGCVDHVSDTQVNASDSDAAQWARGMDESECPPEAADYCWEFLRILAEVGDENGY